MTTKTPSPTMAVHEDHDKLARMVAALRAVIAHGGTPAIVREAVSVLRERISLHFAMEEKLAARAQPAQLDWLKRDHAQLLAALDRVEAAIPSGNAAVRTELENFLATSARHEREVDQAVFGPPDRPHS